MNAKTYLQQLKKIECLIKNKQEELNFIKQNAMFHAIMSTDVKTQITRRIDKLETNIIEYSEQEEEIQQTMVEYWRKRKEIIQTIEQLKPVEYDVLHKVFVQGKRLDDVADDYEKSYSWATTIQGRALRSVQKILDERLKGK